MNIRKMLVICIALLSTVSFAGCDEEKNADFSENTELSENHSSEEKSITEDNSDVDVNENDSILATNGNYTVFLETIGGEVSYPQISGMENEDIQSKINDSLKKLESERYDLMNLQTERYVTSTKVNYFDNEILSLIHNAEFYFEETEDDPASSSTTVNINLKTGEELELQEVADIDKLAEKIYNNEGITILDGYENTSLEDILYEKHIEDTESVKRYLNSFTLDENKNIILSLPSSEGSVKILVENK